MLQNLARKFLENQSGNPFNLNREFEIDNREIESLYQGS